jgi:WD40 repeat protein
MYDQGASAAEENFQPAVRKHFTSINDIVNSTGAITRHPNIGNRHRNIRDRQLLQPHYQHMRKMTLPYCNMYNPADAVCTHFLLQCYNKTRKSAVYSGQWSPDGRRLVLGTKLGELTLWEGETFKFERIVQHKPWMVHPIDTVAWSRNANFLLCGDETGNIIYFDKGMTWVHNVQEMHTGKHRKSM